MLSLIRFLHKKSENLSLTLCENHQDKLPLPDVGGDEGEGGLNQDQSYFVHPHLNPPPSKGEDIIGEISNIFG
jgi:hypothetical protein